MRRTNAVEECISEQCTAEQCTAGQCTAEQCTAEQCSTEQYAAEEYISEEYAVVKSVSFANYKRVITISDIHGDLEGFEGLLQKAKFTKEDALVIVGDILGRGDKPLQLLKRVAALAKQGNIFMVLGNHDYFLQGWLLGKISHEETLERMKRSSDVLAQMAQEIDFVCNEVSQMDSLRQAVLENYREETAFLMKLPHILDSKFAVFVHGRLKPGDLYTQAWRYCLTGDAFGRETYRFEKPVVVGHWPSGNYREGKMDGSVYYNQASNVYCIDGGNSMKIWQQINYLIFAPDGTVLESGFHDTLPKITVLEDQEESEDYVTLVFPYTQLEIREQFAEENRCYVPYLGRDMMLPASMIYHYKGNTYCPDMTTYLLPVKAGETVSFCRECVDGILIKKDGIVGKYQGKYQGKY